MYKWLLIIAFSPFLVQSQTQIKKLSRTENKEKMQIIENLTNYVTYLSSDELEGRRTGTKGELLAANYLIKQYKKIGLTQGNNDKYIQEFTYDEGKLYKQASFFKVNGQDLLAEDKITQSRFDSVKRSLIRHDSDKLALAIISLLK